VPTTKPTGLRKRGGRKLGIPNKATQEIRELIRSTVDWERLALSLEERANGPKGSDSAARTLLEYGFGRPKEMADGNGVSEAELVSAIKGIAAAFMAHPGQGMVTQRDSEVQGIESEI
jgi:hypothetical protein